MDWEAGGGGRDGDPMATLMLSFKSSNAVLPPGPGWPAAGGGGLGGGATPARTSLSSLAASPSPPATGIGLGEEEINPSEAACKKIRDC